MPRRLGGKCRARGDSDAAADDGVSAQVAGGGIGDVHRSALAAAIAGFLAEQFGEHAIGRRSFGQAVSVAAVRAGDVIVDAQSFANSHGHGFFAAVQVGQSGHERAGVELVHLLFKQADAHHLAIGAQPLLFFRGSLAARFRIGSSGCHFFLGPAVTGVVTPDMAASTSNMQAKSYFVQPMAARRSQDLVAHRCRGQRHVELAAQFQREHHVFLHHVHVEPGFFRLLQHEGPAILNHGRRRSRCG